MATSFADEHGWADHNPSRVRQFFGKVGYQDERADLDVSLTLADNALQGTQTLPARWLDTPTQAYTFPDLNENRLAFVAAKGSLFLSEGVLLGGNAYFRHFRNRNLSSNVNDDFGTIDPETGIQQINQATNDRSTIDQSSPGTATSSSPASAAISVTRRSRSSRRRPISRSIVARWAMGISCPPPTSARATVTSACLPPTRLR